MVEEVESIKWLANDLVAMGYRFELSSSLATVAGAWIAGRLRDGDGDFLGWPTQGAGLIPGAADAGMARDVPRCAFGVTGPEPLRSVYAPTRSDFRFCLGLCSSSSSSSWFNFLRACFCT